jgi:hypothetical protein
MEHPAIFAVCAFLMLMVILSWVGYRLIYKPGKFMRQLGRPVITTATQQAIDGSEAEPSTLVTILHGLGSRVPSSEEEVAPLKADLIRAGFRSENALPVSMAYASWSLCCAGVVHHDGIKMRPNGNEARPDGFGNRRRLDSAALLPGKRWRSVRRSCASRCPTLWIAGGR